MLWRQTGKTLYLQIAQILEKEISHIYVPGENLPSEVDLATRFSVNRHTVRHAIDELVDKGLIERRHGKGMFVLDLRMEYLVGQETRFTEQLEATGKTTNSRVLRKLPLPAQGGVAKRLSINEGQKIMWLEILRLVEDRPFCLVSHFLTPSLIEPILDGYKEGSLHNFIAKETGLKLVRSSSEISAVLPMSDDATLLAMPARQPVLRVKSLNVETKNKTPVEYAVTRFRGSRAQLLVNP